MEYSQCGNLVDLLEIIGNLNEKAASKVAKEAISCLIYYHNKKEAFEGLFTENITVTKQGNLKFTPRHEK